MSDTATGRWIPGGAIVCLVTPGATLPFAASTTGERSAALLALVEEAVRSGVDLVQVREPDLPARVLAGIVEASVHASRGTSTRIVVNDRLDVALACGAAGVHLGGGSLPPARARGIAPPGFLIGRSVHSVEEAADAAAGGAVDYLIAGTVFRSASKPDAHPLLGTGGLSAIVRVVKPVPVLAIGGVDLDAVAPVAAAGARGFAAIRFFADAAAGSRLEETVKRARAVFDTVRPIP